MELLLAIILVWAVIFGFVSGAWKEKDVAIAKKAYLESLSALKRNPENAAIKQRTLALGRVYIKLARDKKGRAVFNEILLTKDIDAACGAASVKDQADASEPQKGRTS